MAYACLYPNPILSAQNLASASPQRRTKEQEDGFVRNRFRHLSAGRY